MAKVKGYVETGYVGSRREFEFEIDDEDLSGMTPAEQDDYIEEVARDAMFNCIEWGYERVDSANTEQGTER